MFDKTHNHQLPNAGRTNMHDLGMSEATTLPIPLPLHKRIREYESAKISHVPQNGSHTKMSTEKEQSKVTSAR
jgi:hypothetical protein